MSQAAAKVATGRVKKAAIVPELSNQERMKRFYTKRSKDLAHYTYTPEGDLRIQGAKADPDATIPLRYFSELKPEERQELEERRVTDLMEVEAHYEEALLELRDAVSRYVEGGRLPSDAAAVVRANEEVRLTSVLRSSLAYPSKWITDIPNPSVNEILLKQPKEDRKMGYDVFLFKRQDLDIKDAWGHYRDGPPTEAMQGGAQSTEVIFITDPEDEKAGVFHPSHTQEFVFAETRFVSPYQAYEYARFKELQNESVCKQILGTRSARTIHAIAEKEDGNVKDSLKLWEDILHAFYSQHKDLADKLKATGSAKFHSMDKQFGSQEFVDALEKVRTQLREEAEDATKAPQIAKESVITEDEQKKAKKAAIINNFRKRF